MTDGSDSVSGTRVHLARVHEKYRRRRDVPMNYSIVVFRTSVFKQTDFQKKKKNNYKYRSVAFTCSRGVHLQYPPSRSRPVTRYGSVQKKQSFSIFLYYKHACEWRERWNEFRTKKQTLQIKLVRALRTRLFLRLSLIDIYRYLKRSLTKYALWRAF